MKRNQFLYILKFHHYCYTIPKFEPWQEQNDNFMRPESCAVLHSKMSFESRGQNIKSDDVELWRRFFDTRWRQVRKSAEEEDIELSEEALILELTDMLFRLTKPS